MRISPGAALRKERRRSSKGRNPKILKGWVILTGIHAEAPATWRGGMDFKTPAEPDNAYVASLIHAALNREQLPHF